jgi:DNA primase
MSQIQQIKDAVDIVEVIGDRVDLKRTGRNWRGLCPFHSESSPSFFVNEELQRYKCFGCGEHGDAFTFLEKYEGMTFAEALHHLAERAGIVLEEYKPTAEDHRRDQLLQVLDLAKEYYHYILTDHVAGEPARQYLKERGITQESIKLFQLGYSAPGWEGLLNFLHKKKKYDRELLVEAGLVIRNQSNRYYDRFRGRIMFPLKNHRGQVVGLSGRVLDPKAKEAKYINSPETQLYHKAELLFGYSELLQFIRKENEVIVVEGEFDVISSTQAHVNNIVAIKGSAFTAAHARLIKRVAAKVVFALDMDGAGVEATKRAIPIAQEAGLELRVITLPTEKGEQPKDPDELARHQPKIWREAAKHSMSVYQFLLNAATQKYNPATPEGKRDIVTELATVLGSIVHEVEKDYYLKELAELLSVKLDVVKKDVIQLARNPKGRSRIDDQPVQTDKKLSRREKLERYVWFLLLNDEKTIAHKIEQLQGIEFIDPSIKMLFTQLNSFKQPFSLEAFSKTLPGDLQELLFDLQVTPAVSSEKINIADEWHRALSDLKKLSIEEHIKKITKELDALDQKTIKTDAEEQRQQELLHQIVKLRVDIPL